MLQLQEGVLLPNLMLVEMGLTCFGVRFFVGLYVIALLLLLLPLRISAVLQTIGDPSHDVFLVRREPHSQLEEIGVVHV